jgi:hypothetical protein
VHDLKRVNEQTFAGQIPGMAPTDGGGRVWGDVGKKRKATNVGGEGLGHDFVACQSEEVLEELFGYRVSTIGYLKPLSTCSSYVNPLCMTW